MKSQKAKRSSLVNLSLVLGILAFAVFIFLQLYFKQKIFIASELLKKNTEQFLFLVDLERRRRTPLKLPILLYHYVEVVTDERDTIRKSLNVPPDIFISQLQFLRSQGYTFVHLQDLTDYYEGKASLPDKPVVITFDDGYRDFYTDVLPIITKYQVKVTLFMVSGFLDYTHNYLTTDQFKQISQSPLVEIGGHSVNHPNFHFLTHEDARQEIVSSKKELEILSSKSVNHFAYPYGAYTLEIEEEVENAGFTTGTTVDKGIRQTYKQRFELKRIRPGTLTGPDLINLVEGVF